MGFQQIVNYWLFHNSFSIGISNTVTDRKTMEYITDQIKLCKDNVAKLIKDAYLNKMKSKPGMTICEMFESSVSTELNLACGKSGQYAEKHLKEDNNVKQISITGLKGSYINISQMSACIGQQSVEGKCIPFGFRHHILPHL